MQIFHICSYYINDAFYENMFDELAKNQIESDAFIFANENRKNSGLNRPYAKISYCFNSFDRCFFHLKHKKALSEAKKLFALKKYDYIHAHSLFSNGYIAYRLFCEYGIKYALTIRYPDIFVFYKFLFHLRPLAKKILLNAKNINFLSNSSKDLFFSMLGEKFVKRIINKVHVIPNGIDQFWLDNRNLDKKNVSNTPLKLLFVGKVNKNKNVDILIKICKVYNESYGPCRLTIVGDVQDQKYNEVLKANDFIVYHQFCNKNELLQHYRDSHIFTMLSHRESFGLVYLEAMSQGLPVIYTKEQGFDKQFADGIIGYGVCSSDYLGGVDAINKTVDNYREISKNCIEEALGYSWKFVVEKLIEMYK